MLKMYQRARGAGGSPTYWEDAWAGTSLDDAVRFCEVDPIRPIFLQYLWPGDRILEGGCGPGHYVAYYGDRGYEFVALDFTDTPLRRLKHLRPRTPVCRGDVAHLPFPDNSFDAYYSGGVVEHFEHGPEEALHEAWRVLKPSGVLIISVPYLNGIRRTQQLLHDAGLCSTTTRRLAAPRVEPAPDGQTFFQYVFGKRDFARRLRAHGFRIIESRGTHVMWGLKEVASLRALIERSPGAVSPVVAPVPATPQAAPGASTGRPSGFRRYLKRALVQEDARAFPPIIPLRALAANMMVYVCTAQK